MGIAKFMGVMAMMITKREYLYFCVGALVFFFFSFILFKQVPPTKNHMDIDSGAYVQAANFLLRDGSFAILKTQPYYGLGYPLFLAACKKISGDSLACIIVIQVLLAWFITLLIWRIALLLFNRRAAWIAYALALTHIGLLVFAQLLLTEILLTFLLSLAVERLLTFILSQRSSALVGTGFALGLSCVVKSVALLFLLPLTVFVVVISWDHQWLKHVFLLLVTFFLPYGAYAFHNHLMFEQHERSSMVKINLFYWFYPRLRAEIYGTNSYDEQRYMQRNVSFKEAQEMLIRDVCTYPNKAALALVKNWTKTLFGLYTSNIKLLVDNAYVAGCLSFFSLQGSLVKRLCEYVCGNTEHTWIKALGFFEALQLLIRYVLLLFGFAWLVYKRRWMELFFIVMYLGYFVGISGHDGCARFRMMIDMIVLPLAAGGWASLRILCCVRKKRAI